MPESMRFSLSSLFGLLVLFVIFTHAPVTEGGSIRRRSANGTSLELVHVLFRHGDRTPDRKIIYPTDPHINFTYYPVGNGQLTNAGKRKEYLLGKSLHKRYGKFLGTYNIETVDARCTDYNRTKMSLQLVLASLFPPENELVWEKRLKWQPVPFNYWPLALDHVLADPYKNCPRYKRLYDEFLTVTEGLNMYKKHAEEINYIVRHAQIQPNGKSFSDLYFTLTTEYENGLRLPAWTERVFPDTVRDLAICDYIVSTANRELKKLSSGFLMNKIISDTRRRVQGSLSENTKMFLYSAHEHNLAHFLRFLDVFSSHVPPYGSYISVEIHNVSGIRGIKIFYQDYSSQKPRKLNIPGCENFCRFEKFVSLFKEYLPLTEEECVFGEATT